MKLLERVYKVLINPWKVFAYLCKYEMFNLIPDEIYLKLYYRGTVAKKLDIENPKAFNEKLQWLKLYDRNPLYTKLVDKYEVRKYITKTLGEEYLIPLIGVWDKFEDIDFSKLPNQFVLKCTHDSGGLVICTDKEKLDVEAGKKRINRCLRRNFYYMYREWPYKNVKPRIICERYMLDESGLDLKDYKFMCFNGKVKCSFVCLNRHSSTGLNVDFYDMDWKPIPFERHYKNSGSVIAQPKNFDKMIEFAEKLSKGIPFVRVDFYETNGQLFFGELTFYPGSGFEEFTPESYDYLLGSWIELPK
jgi:hypothetical protein